MLLMKFADSQFENSMFYFKLAVFMSEQIAGLVISRLFLGLIRVHNGPKRKQFSYLSRWKAANIHKATNYLEVLSVVGWGVEVVIGGRREEVLMLNRI